MQTLTDQTVYDSIVSDYYKTDERIIIGNTTYNKDDIESSSVDLILFDDFSIGNATAGQAQIVLKGTPTIGIGDTLTIQQRVRNEAQTSSWFNRGVFFVYSAKVSDDGSKTTITAYDVLYKADYPFMKSGTWVTTTAKVIVETIALDIGVTVHSETLSLLTNDSKDISYIPSIGENGTKARQLLSYIAVLYGGNWTIDVNGYLKLVFVNYDTSDVTVTDDFKQAKFIPKYSAVDRVRIWIGTDTFIQSPADTDTFNALNGYIFEATCPYATQSLADALLATFEGIEYQPYEATNVYLTPIAELGDGITIGGKKTVIGQIKTRFTNTSPSDIGANGVEDEITYNFDSPEEQKIKQVSAELTAQMEIINGQIRTDVGNALDSIRTSLTQTAEGFEAEIASLQTDLDGHATEQLDYLRYTGDGLELGKVQDGQITYAKAILTSTGLKLISPDNDLGAAIEKDAIDGKYKLFVYGGHFVNYTEHGDHWLVVASGDATDHRLTFKARG